MVFFAAAPSASAHVAGPAPRQLQVIKTVAYVGPLQFAVVGKVIYVADSFTSTLNWLKQDGHNTVIATGPDPSTGGDIAGVAVDRADHVACLHQQHRRPLGHHPDDLAAWREAGTADLSKFGARDPDQRITYGIAQPVDPVTTKNVLPTLWPPTPTRPHRVRSKATSATPASLTRTPTP